MVANGLIKALTAESFKTFKKNVGIIDIKNRIKAKKLRKIGFNELKR